MYQNILYCSPLVARNASRQMSELFGSRHRIIVWRQLWLALARAQHEIGLPISKEQIGSLEATIDQIDFARAAELEKQMRHDVMAHLHAWAELAPSAKGVLHLGATSAYVVDNADLIIMRDGLRLIARYLASCIDSLATFAAEHRSTPTLGFTHYQPAQVTTVGKRASLWCYDLVRDLGWVEQTIADLRFRGVKGTTGTQASFLSLLDGDHDKVVKLEQTVARLVDFDRVEPITGQTYSRKVDAEVASRLGQIAASVHKFANDIRLLSNLKEIEEPFENKQVGSSAMPYKRNPMRCERATGLARFVMSMVSSPLQTAAEQWFERTLDDSSNKRLSIPELFLATDGMLRIVSNVSRGLVVYPEMIEARLLRELPFMATEDILMSASSLGGDRQELHELIRQHSMKAGARVKKGEDNDLIERLKGDPAFDNVCFEDILRPARFVGRAPEQVDQFIDSYVAPIRSRYSDEPMTDCELDV